MEILSAVKDMHSTVSTWRQHIHAHPETAFEELETSEFVAQKLEEFGIVVHRGLGKTGVVGTLKCGDSDRVIGLRADMDALFIQEENNVEYKSTVEGKMHACGHDGHTAMLLGAAKYLASIKNFDGTIQFIFQPAEETGDEHCGGNAMVQDGLFDLFPVDCIFGLHNVPGLPLGTIAAKPGAMLASIDTFQFVIKSENIHAAQQHEVADPILAAARVIEAFHAFKARYVNPTEPAIMTITQFKAGDPVGDVQGVHVGPDQALVRGTVYTLDESARDTLENGLTRTIDGIAKAEGVDFEFQYERGYPVLVNAEKETVFAMAVAKTALGKDKVEENMSPVMGAEDFAFMLREKPGCYVMLGTDGGNGNGLPCHLHNPHYDFNDEAIPYGVQYWIKLVETYLAV